MTRDGLTEENLHDGSVKDISHRSRGRPENKEEFVPERERKKADDIDIIHYDNLFDFSNNLIGKQTY